ncbi:MAG: LPS export ABC transporter periplasmic protein LptC [Desulfobacteraceae bacterium]|nr:LPS export ABC transporter periplasmic protein LptC [Desulfobacteraceae bacterium]
MGEDCKNLHIKSLTRSNRINIVVISLIVLLIISIVVIFIRHRADQNHSPAPLRPETTEATLTIKNFHHEASENGKKKWTLEASSASLFASQNMARLTDISIIFLLKKGQNLTIHANQGDLNIKTNDMAITGGITAEIPPYSLTSESLNYEHGSRMIHMNEPVEMTGASMTLKAGALTYDITTEILTCDHHVEGTFIEILK